MHGPLHGVRVLDFTHVLAGPFCTRILGDLGADVVKVGTRGRIVPLTDPTHPFQMLWNRNKRSLALDMSSAEGRAICRRLCDKADIVIDNFSVGILDQWGVGFDAVRQTNPGAIYIAMAGMGQDGPWAKFVTYAPTIHALSGHTHLTSVPGRQDVGPGVSYADHMAGLHAAVATLAALEAHRHTGRGQFIDLSQFEMAVNLLGPALLDYFANGRVAQPCANALPYDVAAPHGCYPCAGEDRWVAVACMTDQQWQALRGVMGSPAWASADRYRSAAGRVEDAPALDQRIAEWTMRQTAELVQTRCQAAGVPAGVVQTGADLVEHDPQLRHARFFRRADASHPVHGVTSLDRIALRFSKTDPDTYRPTALLGADNVPVLRDWLEMSEPEVRDGEKDGTFR